MPCQGKGDFSFRKFRFISCSGGILEALYDFHLAEPMVRFTRYPAIYRKGSRNGGVGKIERELSGRIDSKMLMAFSHPFGVSNGRSKMRCILSNRFARLKSKRCNTDTKKPARSRYGWIERESQGGLTQKCIGISSALRAILRMPKKSL